MHLGFVSSPVGSNAPEITARLCRATKVWQTMGRVWHTRAISLHVRLLFFRSLMVNALLSGLEACAITDLELSRIESYHMRKLRILLHGQAARQTNDWVRAFTHCPTFASQLQARRIHWLQVLLTSPSHHLPALASTTGFRATPPQ
eukprot:6985170-Heterocapsa_arctica.AAC.1